MTRAVDAALHDDMPPVAITIGEPSGIGPDLILDLAAKGRLSSSSNRVVLADPQMLERRARRLNLDIPFSILRDPQEIRNVEPGRLPILPLVNGHGDTPGKIDPANAAGTIEAIDRSVALAFAGKVSAIVTAPIDKKALYDAGFSHPGHTEYLADLCFRRTGEWRAPVMLLAGPELSCVPVTIHIPIADVPNALTSDLIVETCRIVERDLRTRFGVARPRLAVAGLNPHAGERGSIGLEDERVIRPAIEVLRVSGMEIAGPLPADTMFNARAREKYDVAICMYHDQALIPAKTIAFDETVNITLGLPIIRTSPDHGTASDIAAMGIAKTDSFEAALERATMMARISAPQSATSGACTR